MSVIDALFILFVIDTVRNSRDISLVVKVLAAVGTLAAGLLLIESLTGVRVGDMLRPPFLPAAAVMSAASWRRGRAVTEPRIAHHVCRSC
ncbi:MAG TPA: hypothetical protein PL091_16485 [Actinomycetota bacterium]|nr:hypothetical protein [Actinomycetota bacterium]HRY11455.1 hypothetical protein [Candidatus Nanopelagicales bacterium]